MQPREERLLAEIETLTRRIERIERQLGLQPGAAPDSGPRGTTPPPTPESRAPVPSHPSVGIAIPPRIVPPIPVAATARMPEVSTNPSEPAGTPPPPRSADGGVGTAAQDEPGDDGWGFERRVGGRWYAVAGAMIVTVGVALFFKLALDRGWLSFPPVARCLAGAGFGFAMLVAGEWIRRRSIGQHAAFQSFAPVGLNAAGVGCVYAAAFAAYGLYRLVGSAGGFILLAAAAALGIAVGARARQAAVGVIALLGGYAAPFLVEAPDPHPLVMPAYLLALLIVGETLCGWRGGRFGALRIVAWLGTVGIGALWTLDQGASHLTIGTGFLAGVWLIVHAELVWTALRRGFPSVNWYRAGLREDWAAIRPFAVSLSTSVWSAGLATILVRRWGGTEEWLPCAIGAAACGALGVALGRGGRVLLTPPRSGGERLAALLLVQSGAATIGALALGMAGWAEVVAWLAMGLAAIAAGSRLGSRALQVYGLVVLAIAAGRLALHDAWTGELTAGGVNALGLVLTRWSLLMAVAGAAWVIAGVALGWGAWRLGVRTGWRIAGEAAVTTGIALATASLFNPHGDSFSMIASLITAGFVLIGLAAALRSTLVATAAFMAYAAAAAWIGLNGWFLRSTAGPGVEVLGLHLTRYTALAAYAAFGWLAAARLLLDRGLPDLGGPAPSACAGLGVVLAGLSIVHQDTSLATLSAAWGLMAVALAAARPLVPGLHPERFAVAELAAAFGAWIGAYPPYPAEAWAEHVALPLLSRPFLQGLWVACAVLGVAWVLDQVRAALVRRVQAAGDDAAEDVARCANGAELARDLRRVCVAAAVAVVWLATTSEAARVAGPWSADSTARHAAASIWWGVFGVGMIVAGFVRRLPAVRHIGLALLGVATGKALLLDLAAVAMEGRVASFIGLGLLMLGVAVLYARIAARLGDGAGRSIPDGHS